LWLQADASEKLRQRRLSHMYPHPVHILQTRSCPLEPPPVPEKVPGWKLIRPRKKQPLPTDLPAGENYTEIKLKLSYDYVLKNEDNLNKFDDVDV
jgi:hypothetical protein